MCGLEFSFCTQDTEKLTKSISAPYVNDGTFFPERCFLGSWEVSGAKGSRAGEE